MVRVVGPASPVGRGRSAGDGADAIPRAFLDSTNDWNRPVEGLQNFQYLRPRDVRPSELTAVVQEIKREGSSIWLIKFKSALGDAIYEPGFRTAKRLA